MDRDLIVCKEKLMGKGFLVIDPFLMNSSISSMGERKNWRKGKEINYKKVKRLSARSGENYENFRVNVKGEN